MNNEIANMFFNKKLLMVPTLLLALILLGAGCSDSSDSSLGNSEAPVVSERRQADLVALVEIKYRDTPVNLFNRSFDAGDLHDSSFVFGAWYDEDNEYLVLDLNDTYYHYCGVPTDIWEGLQEADSHGSYYNTDIKGDYSCEGVDVPEYE